MAENVQQKQQNQQKSRIAQPRSAPASPYLQPPKQKVQQNPSEKSIIQVLDHQLEQL